MNSLKKFFKELKRVKWPTGKEANKTFFQVLIFIVITSLLLFGLALGLASLWDAWGVGI